MKSIFFVYAIYACPSDIGMMVNISRGDVYAHRFLLRSLGNNMVLLCDMAAVDVMCYA